MGNVIAFNSRLGPMSTIGAFNDRARDVWAWAVAEVPAAFHPRHAVERWYRYHLFSDLPLSALRRTAQLFVGAHDFRSFTTDHPVGPMAIDGIDVAQDGRVIVFDIKARSFRRAMVRRIVAAVTRAAAGEIGEDDIRSALRGTLRDFGAAAPEPLFLMDVRYPFSMKGVLTPKVGAEFRLRMDEVEIDQRFLASWREALEERLVASARGADFVQDIREKAFHRDGP